MAKKTVPGLYRRARSPYWWAKWYRDGVPVRESTGHTRITEAKKFLDTRRGAQAEGKPILPPEPRHVWRA